MKVIDDGHKYRLDHLDGEGYEILTFVKREGLKYPNNIGSYEGTNIQEVLRALINRIGYLNCQEFDIRNNEIISSLRHSILLLEQRAADKHDRTLINVDLNNIEHQPVCVRCKHIGCSGRCFFKDK